MAIVFLGHEIPSYNAEGYHELTNRNSDLYDPQGSNEVEEHTPTDSPFIELVVCTQALIAFGVNENAIFLKVALSDQLHEAIRQEEQNEELKQSQQERLEHQPPNRVHALARCLYQVNPILKLPAQSTHLAAQEDTQECQEHTHPE